MEADLIAHSMGGLVARNYALKESKIRRMITIGTPNYGGNFANGLGDIILNNQAEDLEYGNATAWKLHREWEARLAGMPKLMAICGTNNFEFGVYNESDVLVKCSSASLENFGYPVYYVPRKHSSSQPLLGKAIADIDDAMHDSWPPIKRFLSEQDAPFVGLAGNLGGADDVGDKDHSSPLSGGMAYVLAHKGTPTSLDSLDANKVLWSPKINAELWGAHEIPLTGSGVYFLVGGTATGKNTGDRSYKNYKVTIQGSGITTESQDVKLFAGQTTVISMGDKGAPYLSDDTDGDLIPDHVEDEIIRYKTADRVLSLADVSEDGDFDGDGLTELLEVSLGSSSLIANHDDADTFSARAEDGFLVLRHSESKRDHGLKVVCEESTTLTGWRVARAEMRIILDLSTKQIKEWRLPIDGNQQFMRIKVKKR